MCGGDCQEHERITSNRSRQAAEGELAWKLDLDTVSARRVRISRLRQTPRAHRDPISSRRTGLGLGSVVLPELNDQVGENAEVHDEYQNAQPAVFLDDLIDLERNERARGDDDEVSGPVVFENQPDALDEVQERVKESASLNGTEMRSVDARNCRDQSMDQVVMGIEAEMGADSLDRLRRVVAAQIGRMRIP